jgi:hypothetical protein
VNARPDTRCWFPAARPGTIRHEAERIGSADGLLQQTASSALLCGRYSDFTHFVLCITSAYHHVFQVEIAVYFFYRDVSGLEEAEPLVKAIGGRLVVAGATECDQYSQVRA